MFTSKKAQYLDNKFNNISPITNIDSLYYEQAEKENPNDQNSSIIIHRRSFVKNMPVQFNKDFKFIDTSFYVLESLDFNELPTINDNEHVYLNAQLHTIEYNPRYNMGHLYESSLFSVICETYVDLHELLLHYQQLYYFDISIQAINDWLSSTDIQSLDASIAYMSEYVSQLQNLMYNNDKVTPEENNDIYFIEYNPCNRPNPDMYIKVQNISINGSYEQISLDNASSYDNHNLSEKLQFHYDTKTKKITYLKDENGNEGNYDFINVSLGNNKLIGLTTYNNRLNNKIYIDPENSSIFFNTDNYYSEKKQNTIINSTNIFLKGKIINNTICNASPYTIVIIDSSNNKIYNLQNSSIYIKNANNNTIINCNNCSINIQGKNNYIANLSNLTLNLNNNNIIIGDNSTNVNPLNTSILNNTKLFFNDSVRLAYEHQELQNNTIVFGSNTNNINVYTKNYILSTVEYSQNNQEESNHPSNIHDYGEVIDHPIHEGGIR